MRENTVRKNICQNLLERSWQINCKKTAIKIKLKNDRRSNEKLKSFLWQIYTV